ncbi:hypothetical protein BJF81_14130 [Ornithinimicrobium sp. CNJ-824]|uniref:PQQ-dependent sugar dehydrogenase n=1 Tax=Ornithinimicrobium sp. CNJ-824 TaxID=1904966 RepID=UPI00095FBD85|nr:PQQ-dependent sugar dehydrogenase [Ornithinimicrobium sp. CNJ-824]OLT21978.1 hypothetical protein BJF81_14130 [Ornithinimicrobium sp. CNJ-824]
MDGAVHPRIQVAVVAAASILLAGCGDPPDPVGGPVPGLGASTAGGTSTVRPDTGDGDPPAGVAVTVTETIATGLQTPWGVGFLPDGTALVTLRDTGQVLLLDDGRSRVLDAGGPEGGVPDVVHEIEDGLMGIAIGPDGGVYLYLTTSSDNRVVRYDLEDGKLVNPQVVLAGVPANEIHSGGRIAFGPDGYLYVTTGDTRDRDLPQDTDSLAGKILRVTATGEPAPGNPFENEVWSYGHRNVQGIGWTSDGRMYASEFGSDRYDELNLIEPGSNYGWPHTEGWAGDPDYVDPLVTWPNVEASPSGIAVTDDGVWISALRGERLWYVPLDPSGKPGPPVAHDLGLGRLRTVVTAPDGDLWIVTSNTDGRGQPGELDDRILALEISTN